MSYSVFWVSCVQNKKRWKKEEEKDRVTWVDELEWVCLEHLAWKEPKNLHQLQKTLGRRIQFKTVLVQVGARAMSLNLHTQNEIAAYWNPLLQSINSNHISIRRKCRKCLEFYPFLQEWPLNWNPHNQIKYVILGGHSHWGWWSYKGAYALINKATKTYCDSLFIIAERKSVHQALKDPALSLWKGRLQASRLANKCL